MRMQKDIWKKCTVTERMWRSCLDSDGVDALTSNVTHVAPHCHRRGAEGAAAERDLHTPGWFGSVGLPRQRGYRTWSVDTLAGMARTLAGKAVWSVDTLAGMARTLAGKAVWGVDTLAGMAHKLFAQQRAHGTLR
eukprot:366245-Chlamydomonas_euryale.AAC.16